MPSLLDDILKRATPPPPRGATYLPTEKAVSKALAQQQAKAAADKRLTDELLRQAEIKRRNEVQRMQSANKTTDAIKQTTTGRQVAAAQDKAKLDAAAQANARRELQADKAGIDLANKARAAEGLPPVVVTKQGPTPPPVTIPTAGPASPGVAPNPNRVMGVTEKQAAADARMAERATAQHNAAMRARQRDKEIADELAAKKAKESPPPKPDAPVAAQVLESSVVPKVPKKTTGKAGKAVKAGTAAALLGAAAVGVNELVNGNRPAASAPTMPVGEAPAKAPLPAGGPGGVGAANSGIPDMPATPADLPSGPADSETERLMSAAMAQQAAQATPGGHPTSEIERLMAAANQEGGTMTPQTEKEKSLWGKFLDWRREHGEPVREFGLNLMEEAGTPSDKDAFGRIGSAGIKTLKNRQELGLDRAKQAAAIQKLMDNLEIANIRRHKLIQGVDANGNLVVWDPYSGEPMPAGMKPTPRGVTTGSGSYEDIVNALLEGAATR